MSAASVVCGLPAAVARSRNQQPCVRPQQRGAAAALAARRPATAAAACQRRAVVAAAASSSSSATAVDVEAQMGVLRQACRTKDVPAEVGPLPARPNAVVPAAEVCSPLAC